MKEYNNEKLKKLRGERSAEWLIFGSLITQIPFWIYLNAPYAYISAISLFMVTIVRLVFNYSNEKIYM